MFFKKKKEIKLEQIEQKDVSQYTHKADELQKELVGKTGDERIALLDQIGICYRDAHDYDQAIAYLEMSLHEKKAIGKGYTTLLKLYNEKRKEAAIQKDDESLQYYLAKLDDMMTLSKDVIRGK